jgi:hypothetical protein
MCSDARRVASMVIAAFALIAAVARPSLAQSATQYDALRSYWTERSRAADEALRAFRRSVDSTNVDTIRTLRADLVSPAALSTMARDVARVADSLVQGTWLPPREGERARFELRVVPGRVRLNAFGEAMDGVNPPRVSLYLRPADGSAKALVVSDTLVAVREAAAMMMRTAVVGPSLNALDPMLRRWANHQPASHRPSALDFEILWDELTTYPSLPARGCVVGDLRSCEVALALVEEKDPARVWYDPSLRRVLAARWMRRFSKRHPDFQAGTHWDSTAVVRACESGRDDDACLRFLSDRLLGASMIEPGPLGLRVLLLRYAFSFPVDASPRAEAAFAPGLTIQRRLELASGLPFDELLRRFHQQLAMRRSPPLAPSAASLWATSLWCLAGCALGLRTTRWRV